MSEYCAVVYYFECPHIVPDGGTIVLLNTDEFIENSRVYWTAKRGNVFFTRVWEMVDVAYATLHWSVATTDVRVESPVHMSADTMLHKNRRGSQLW